MTGTPRLATLASGRGSNVRALLEAHQRGDLSAPVVLVISNNSRSGVLELARSRGLEARHISGRTHDDEAAALLAALHEFEVDLVVLAGYMKLLDPRIIAAYPDRIVNIHPGPLPRFGGKGMHGQHVHRAVLDSGASTSGPTVHLVDEVYDQGRILAHQAVPVRPGDTVESLAARVLDAEHDLYWRTIEQTFARRQPRPS